MGWQRRIRATCCLSLLTLTKKTTRGFWSSSGLLTVSSPPSEPSGWARKWPSSSPRMTSLTRECGEVCHRLFGRKAEATSDERGDPRGLGQGASQGSRRKELPRCCHECREGRAGGILCSLVRTLQAAGTYLGQTWREVR